MNQTTLNALALFPLQLEAHFAAIPADFRRWAPPSWHGVPSEPFTAIEQLCHVRDLETEGYQSRIRRTLHEEHPLLLSIDSGALAVERDYTHADAAEVMMAFRDARARTIVMLTALTPDELLRTAEFEGYGTVTLRSLAHYLCSHDQQHLAGLQWLLGKIEATRAR
ncbi:DinB family protein [Lysobacter niastensis]|uniref:DinB family protein n=1 Tax=Lysobacter niastensis TaxID=380629 RepID=A0ABS0B802_9GAMM|nr:DinB family protein [Lysobacter niastensis]MBF6025136.1 DinB family protein [Lysobacter niastensis]